MSGAVKKPEWLKVRYNADEVREVAGLMNALGLHTVCRSANCPNLPVCYAKRTATFMILGDRCTRSCRFCNIDHASAADLRAPDPEEPRKIAEAVRDLGLRHAVVTCVTRDDLPDGGASEFAAVIREIRAMCPGVTVEVLISDFRGDGRALDTVMREKPDVLNHNIETVPSLYAAVRPGAEFQRSLDVLRRAKAYGTSYVKTGIMLGLGEGEEEIADAFRAVAETGCDILTVSQYLQPSPAHAPLCRYVTPEEFGEYKKLALSMGIRYVVSAPLVRSSYLAADALDALKEGQA